MSSNAQHDFLKVPNASGFSSNASRRLKLLSAFVNNSTSSALSSCGVIAKARDQSEAALPVVEVTIRQYSAKRTGKTRKPRRGKGRKSSGRKSSISNKMKVER